MTEAGAAAALGLDYSDRCRRGNYIETRLSSHSCTCTLLSPECEQAVAAEIPVRAGPPFPAIRIRSYLQHLLRRAPLSVRISGSVCHRVHSCLSRCSLHVSSAAFPPPEARPKHFASPFLPVALSTVLFLRQCRVPLPTSKTLKTLAMALDSAPFSMKLCKIISLLLASISQQIFAFSTFAHEQPVMSEVMCLPLGQAERFTLETVCTYSRRGLCFERLLGGLRFVLRGSERRIPVSYAGFHLQFIHIWGQIEA